MATVLLLLRCLGAAVASRPRAWGWRGWLRPPGTWARRCCCHLRCWQAPPHGPPPRPPPHRVRPAAVIADEVHLLKNCAAKTYKAAATLGTALRYGLSGTVMQVTAPPARCVALPGACARGCCCCCCCCCGGGGGGGGVALPRPCLQPPGRQPATA